MAHRHETTCGGREISDVHQGAMTPGVAQQPREPAVGRGLAVAEEEMPRVVVTRRRAVGFVVFILAAVGFLYFVLPNLAGVSKAVHHIERGDKWWIAIGVLFELLSFAGYVVLFRAVFVRG